MEDKIKRVDELVELLNKCNYEYYVLNSPKTLSDYEFDFVVRDTVKAERLLDAVGLNQKLCVGSLADRYFIDSLFEGGVDTLLHIAGIGYSEELVDTAVKANVKRLILVHTTGIYSKYKSAGEGYRRTESKIDEMVKGKNISLTYLRPTMIYGNVHDANVVIFMKMVDKLMFHLLHPKQLTRFYQAL